jgi:hypothetical protein
VTKQTSEVEIPTDNTIDPLANSLTCYTRALGSVSESGFAIYSMKRAVDIRYAVDFAGQNIARKNTFTSPTVRFEASGQHHIDLTIITRFLLESTAHPGVGKLQLLAATTFADAACKNRHVASRNGLGIFGRLHRKYVYHHVPPDGLGIGKIWPGPSPTLPAFTHNRRKPARERSGA